MDSLGLAISPKYPPTIGERSNLVRGRQKTLEALLMLTFLEDKPELNSEKEDAVLTIEGVAGVLLRFSADVKGGGSYVTDTAMYTMLADVLLDAVAVLKMDEGKEYRVVEA